MQSAMQSAMLAGVLMLPIALAAIYPCPLSSSSPSSEDSSGCSSDGNENQLQCAVLPGLSAAHPGPCAPPEVTAGRSRRYTPSVDDILSIIDGLKKVEYLEWQECYNERQCAQPHWGNCTECGADDWKCSRMCEFNCGCGCIGLQTTAGLDEDTYDQWEECYLKRGCTLSKKEKCEKNCAGDRSCRDSCHMERERCMCGCVQHAATRTSTTTATTAWSTPSTTEAVTSATEVETSSTESVTGTTEAVTMTSSIEAVTSTTDAKTSANDAVTATAITEVETTTTEVETNTTMSETNTTVVETKNTKAVTNATELEASTEKGNTSARVTTSTVDWTWRNYMTCKDQSRDCGRDSLLPEVRRDNCTCGCMGLLGGNLDMYDSSVVQNCLGDCGDQETKCDDGCRRQEPCLDSCRLSKQHCRCECNHHTHGTT